MKEVLSVSILSLAHSVRLALESEGIEAVVQGEAIATTIGRPYSVWVLDDAEVARALRVIRELERQ